jgi:hypothetical protein
VFRTELKTTRGENLIAALHLAIQYGVTTHKVASVHGRRDGGLNVRQERRLRYVNREKA